MSVKASDVASVKSRSSPLFTRDFFPAKSSSSWLKDVPKPPGYDSNFAAVLVFVVIDKFYVF